MNCIHNNFEGICSYYDKNVKDPNLGTDDNGYCVCEDDECPVDQCTYFETEEDEDEE